MNDLDWMEQGRCAEVDGDLFFPDHGANTTTLRDAKRVCMSCEVRAQCLDYALATAQEFGVWGGLSSRQRTRLRQDRQKVAA